MSDRGQALPTRQEVSLVELLDRALGAGVVITGDLTISLADIELVYVNLRLLVGSVGTIQGERSHDSSDDVLTIGQSSDDRP